jgi:hypothetical protein
MDCGIAKVAIGIGILVVMQGCTGGQTGEIAPPNCMGPATFFDVSEETPLGMSGQEVLEALGGSYSSPLVFSDGEEAELSVTVSHETELLDDGRIRYAPPLRDGSSCVETIDVPVRVRFVTADGRFDEELVDYLRAPGTDEGRVRAIKSASTLDGSIDLSTFSDGAGFSAEGTDVFFDLTLRTSGTEGFVEMTSRSTDNPMSLPQIAAW